MQSLASSLPQPGPPPTPGLAASPQPPQPSPLAASHPQLRGVRHLLQRHQRQDARGHPARGAGEYCAIAPQSPVTRPPSIACQLREGIVHRGRLSTPPRRRASPSSALDRGAVPSSRREHCPACLLRSALEWPCTRSLLTLGVGAPPRRLSTAQASTLQQVSVVAKRSALDAQRSHLSQCAGQADEGLAASGFLSCALLLERPSIAP